MSLYGTTRTAPLFNKPVQRKLLQESPDSNWRPTMQTRDSHKPNKDDHVIFKKSMTKIQQGMVNPNSTPIIQKEAIHSGREKSDVCIFGVENVRKSKVSNNPAPRTNAWTRNELLELENSEIAQVLSGEKSIHNGLIILNNSKHETVSRNSASSINKSHLLVEEESNPDQKLLIETLQYFENKKKKTEHRKQLSMDVCLSNSSRAEVNSKRNERLPLTPKMVLFE